MSSCSFSEGERVLCYEPDPTKVRVVYEAKILQVAPPEKKGEETLYLVHFQGWNSSWDRFVPADFLLKDNEENRALKKKLVQEADKALKDSKKAKRNRKRKSNENETCDAKQEKEEVKKAEKKVTPKAGSASGKKRRGGAKAKEEPKKEEEVGGETVDPELEPEEEVFDDADVPLPLSDAVRDVLSEDFRRVGQRGELHRLPAATTVVKTLEDFVHNFGCDRLAAHDKTFARSASVFAASGQRKERARDSLDAILDQINLAKEIAEGLRVCVDFYLGELLLYNCERDQYKSLMVGKKFEDYVDPDIQINIRPQLPSPSANEASSSTPTPPPSGAFTRLLRRSASSVPSDAGSEPSSGRSSPATAGGGGAGGGGSSVSSIPATVTAKSGLRAEKGPRGDGTGRKVVEERAALLRWRLLPPSVAKRAEGFSALASTVYGPVHLLRLFVKMPRIMGKMRMNPKKAKTLVKYFGFVMSYLEKTVQVDDEMYQK